MKKQQLLMGAVLVALSLSACSEQETETTTELAEKTSSSVTVQVSPVTSEDIATDNKVSGQFEAEDEATVMVAVSAKCTKTYVDTGDEVKRGDILCTLNLDSTLSQYNAARINHDSAIQSYNDQKSAFDDQIAVAREQVAVAAGQIDIINKQITTTEEQIAASEEQIRASEEQIAASEEQLTVSEKQIETGEEQLVAAQEQIAVLEESIELMEPTITLAEKNVSDTQALFEIGAASQIELDQAQISADQANFGRDQAVAQLTQARAQLDQSEAQLEQSKAQLNQSKAQLNQSKAQLNQSKAQLNQSKTQIDQLKVQLQQAELQRNQAQVQVTQAENTKTSTLAQLQAGIENARANVQQLENVLADVDKNGNVIAPINGTLATFNAIENSYISNAMPIAVINGNDQMKLTASVSEALAPKLHVGDVADVYVSSLDKHISANIRSMDRSANAQTKLYTVTLSIPKTDGVLAGMFADVTFHTDQVSGAIVIPSEAILTNGSTEYVFLVENSIAKYTEVTTGLTGTGVTEILSGLYGGENLVTVGQSYLSDGDAVRVVSGE